MRLLKERFERALNRQEEEIERYGSRELLDLDVSYDVYVSSEMKKYQ